MSDLSDRRPPLASRRAGLPAPETCPRLPFSSAEVLAELVEAGQIGANVGARAGRQDADRGNPGLSRGSSANRPGVCPVGAHAARNLRPKIVVLTNPMAAM